MTRELVRLRDRDLTAEQKATKNRIDRDYEVYASCTSCVVRGIPVREVVTHLTANKLSRNPPFRYPDDSDLERNWIELVYAEVLADYGAKKLIGQQEVLDRSAVHAVRLKSKATGKEPEGGDKTLWDRAVAIGRGHKDALILAHEDRLLAEGLAAVKTEEEKKAEVNEAVAHFVSDQNRRRAALGMSLIHVKEN